MQVKKDLMNPLLWNRRALRMEQLASCVGYISHPVFIEGRSGVSGYYFMARYKLIQQLFYYQEVHFEPSIFCQISQNRYKKCMSV